jgi:hypothetical protein
MMPDGLLPNCQLPKKCGRIRASLISAALAEDPNGRTEGSNRIIERLRRAPLLPQHDQQSRGRIAAA